MILNAINTSSLVIGTQRPVQFHLDNSGNISESSVVGTGGRFFDKKMNQLRVIKLEAKYKHGDFKTYFSAHKSSKAKNMLKKIVSSCMDAINLPWITDMIDKVHHVGVALINKRYFHSQIRDQIKRDNYKFATLRRLNENSTYLSGLGLDKFFQPEQVAYKLWNMWEKPDIKGSRKKSLKLCPQFGVFPNFNDQLKFIGDEIYRREQYQNLDLKHEKIDLQWDYNDLNYLMNIMTANYGENNVNLQLAELNQELVANLDKVVPLSKFRKLGRKFRRKSNPNPPWSQKNAPLKKWYGKGLVQREFYGC